MLPTRLAPGSPARAPPRAGPCSRCALRLPATANSTSQRRCALARLSEVDNIHLASTTTPGGIVIPGGADHRRRTLRIGRHGAAGSHRRRHRGHGPAGRRDRRAERALSRHLADLCGRALRQWRLSPRGSTSSTPRRPRMRWRSRSRLPRPASATTTRRPRRAGSPSGKPRRTGSPLRGRRKRALRRT